MLELNLYTPDFVIDCKYLTRSGDIYPIMREHGIKRSYTYGMIYYPNPLIIDFLKIGKSSPKLGSNREHQVGERIVRQASWVPGWESPHPSSDTGSAFWHSIKYNLMEKKLVKHTFNKNDLSIAVWDVTKRVIYSDIISSSDEEFDLCTWAEGELSHQYKLNNNGRLPYLNVSDPTATKIYKGAYVSKKGFNNLFEIS